MIANYAFTRLGYPASRCGLCVGLRQLGVMFLQGFLAVTAYRIWAFSYFFMSAANRYSGLLKPAWLTRQSIGLACGQPLAFICQAFIVKR
jgi:hypothetical protein